MNKVEQIKRILVEGYRGSYPSNRELTYAQFCDALADFEDAVKEECAFICNDISHAIYSQRMGSDEAYGVYLVKKAVTNACADAIRKTKVKCRKCGGNMKPGQALRNIATCDSLDMGEAVTVSEGTKAKLIDCMKCEKCGWSVTVATEESGV